MKRIMYKEDSDQDIETKAKERVATKDEQDRVFDQEVYRNMTQKMYQICREVEEEEGTALITEENVSGVRKREPFRINPQELTIDTTNWVDKINSESKRRRMEDWIIRTEKENKLELDKYKDRWPVNYLLAMVNRLERANDTRTEDMNEEAGVVAEGTSESNGDDQLSKDVATERKCQENLEIEGERADKFREQMEQQRRLHKHAIVSIIGNQKDKYEMLNQWQKHLAEREEQTRASEWAVNRQLDLYQEKMNKTEADRHDFDEEKERMIRVEEKTGC